MTTAPIRGPLAMRQASAAARGRLELPVCADCGHVQYPPRERCGHCLGERVAWREVPSTGRLLSRATVAVSSVPAFRDRLPLPIGTVRLDAGPVMIVFLPRVALEIGARVQVRAGLDRAGHAVLFARAADATEALPSMIDPNQDIAGRTVLITGGGRGIGQALAAAFLKAGAGRVIATVRRGDAPDVAYGPDAPQGTHQADPAPAPVGAETPVIEYRPLDVTDAASVRALAAACDGTVDILVNNAGVNGARRLFAADAEQAAADEIAVNYLGMLRMIRAFAPPMRSRGRGVIVNLLSVLSHVNQPLLATYAASKAAALSLTQAARAELMPAGVRVCGVFPSLVDTSMSAAATDPKLAPAALAQMVVAMLRDGVEDLYPPGPAERLREALAADPKAVERQMAGRLPRDTRSPV